MTTVLITGANKGLGRETARRLITAGHTVYVGARDERRCQEAAASLGGRPVLIDVTDDDSVRAAAERIREEVGHLDVLVNNAGVIGPGNDAHETTAAHVRIAYETNVFGVVRVTHAFLPLLEASAAPVVVNVSSSLGSPTVAGEPDRFTSILPVYYPALAYNSSKAALNSLTVQYARANPKMRINSVDPGHTATDLNGYSDSQTVTEGCRSFEGVWHERDLRVLDSPRLRRVSDARPYGAVAAERVLWETGTQVGRDSCGATMDSIRTKSQVGQTLKRSAPVAEGADIIIRMALVGPDAPPAASTAAKGRSRGKWLA